MRQSKTEVYLHVVWTTARREPFLIGELKHAIYRCIEKEAQRLGCAVLELGGMPDHVHLCIRIPTRLAIARLMNQVKGVSSHMVHDCIPNQAAFAWQEGYGVFSVGPNQVSRVLAYIQDQEAHHAAGTTHAHWEETDEEYQPRVRS